MILIAVPGNVAATAPPTSPGRAGPRRCHAHARRPRRQASRSRPRATLTAPPGGRFCRFDQIPISHSLVIPICNKHFQFVNGNAICKR